LNELDEKGFTNKVGNKGRELSEQGRAELQKGNVRERIEEVRARIAQLTSQVTFDPFDQTGLVVASAVTVPEERIEETKAVLAALEETPLKPIPVQVTSDDEVVELRVPSSITMDGVLINQGIAPNLICAGITEYVPRYTDRPGTEGGEILRYTDAISGESSSMDVVSLLIKADQTNISDIVSGSDSGLIVVDNREIPLTSYNNAREMVGAVRSELGGVVDIRRPREPGPFPYGGPGWGYASITYGGVGENVIGALVEKGIARSWETLQGHASISEFTSSIEWIEDSS
jgi:hypothetical protein